MTLALETRAMAITRLRSFAADRSGAVAIEYTVLMSGVALTIAMTVVPCWAIA